MQQLQLSKVMKNQIFEGFVLVRSPYNPGLVTRYRLSGGNAGGTTRAKYICAVGGLYPRTHANYAKDVTATIPLDAFPEGTTRFCVTPIDAFGNAGRALVANLPA